MKSVKLFSVAFLLGFATCAALVYFYSGDFSSPQRSVDSQEFSAAGATEGSATNPSSSSSNSIERDPTVAQPGSPKMDSEPSVDRSEADYWLQQLKAAQASGNTEEVVTALRNFSHFELDGQRLNAMLDEFKSSYFRSVNRFLSSAEPVDALQLNGLEIRRFIARMEPLLEAMPGDAELHWILSRLYRLIGDEYQADYYQVIAASDPRIAAQLQPPAEVGTENDEADRAAQQSLAPIQAPLIIALQRHQHHFLVKTVISGRPALLLLDTGASLTGVTQSFAERYPRMVSSPRPILLDTAGGSAKGSLFTAKTVELGDLVFRDHPTVVFPVLDNQHFDGVLGLDILGRFDFYIDQPRAELHLRYRLQ